MNDQRIELEAVRLEALAMLRRGQTTTFQERLDISERATAGQSDREIAAALGCSVWTVRKWRRRGQHQGRPGLGSQMGRPVTGPLGTLPAGMREAILKMRQTHPGWGPTTLLAELRIDPRWTDQPLPSRSRIAARLRAEHLTRRYQKHSDLPTPMIQVEGAPHDEWELDAQGRMHVAGVGKVCLITILDVVSRLKVESSPCLDTTNPPFEAYQLMLRRASPFHWPTPAYHLRSRHGLLRQHFAVALSHPLASVAAGLGN